MDPATWKDYLALPAKAEPTRKPSDMKYFHSWLRRCACTCPERRSRVSSAPTMATIQKQQGCSPTGGWRPLIQWRTASNGKKQVTMTHQWGTGGGRGGRVTSVTWSSARSQTQRGLLVQSHVHQVHNQVKLTCGLRSQAPYGEEEGPRGAGHRDTHFVTGHCARSLGFWSFSA